MSGPTPRTDAEPMAFTGGEFARGAIVAWGWAMALPFLAWTVIFFPYGFVSIMFVVPTATAATVLFAVVAWWLGHALRRVRRIATHVILFALLGAAIGVASTVGFNAWDDGTMWADRPLYVFIVNAACGAAAVALGWRHTARKALRLSRISVDPDAAHEDALARGDG